MENGYKLIERFFEHYFGKRGARVVFYLVLMAFGITHTEIQAKYGTAFSTLRRYRNAVKNGDITPLFIVAERVRDRSELDEFEEEIMNDFKEKIRPQHSVRHSQELR